MIKGLFKKDTALDAGRALYTAAVEQARAAPLYADYGAPDTVEGRFEQVTLHVYLVMRRLKGEGPQSARPRDKNSGKGANPKEVSQCLFDAMFQNMDDSLRELGVGDLVVGKKIRKMAENFFGRVAAYEEALKPDADPAALEIALARNIFARSVTDCAHDGPSLFATYVRTVSADLAEQPTGRMLGGIVTFPPVPKAKSAETTQ